MTAGNQSIELELTRDTEQSIRLSRFRLAGGGGHEWGETASPFGPVVRTEAGLCRAVDGSLAFVDATWNAEHGQLELRYRGCRGIEVTQVICPAVDKPVLRAWTVLANHGTRPLAGISRFDALHLPVAVGGVEPECLYVLGWMEGPRVDAPGRHTTPWKYEGWIPRFLYGENKQIPPPPPGGWTAGPYRVVQERLTRLPLRSGKRSTYENQPWAVLLDRSHADGLLMGFEWSGTWLMELEHFPETSTVTAFASSDGDVHTLEPGQTLTSPPVFVGLFEGGPDEAGNLCRDYLRDEIIPASTKPWPTTMNVHWSHMKPDKRSDAQIIAETDAAAELGFETRYVEAAWWDGSAWDGDFSIGLGSVTEDRRKFPMGMRAVSDYLHGKGMNFGIWMEFERVDIRTANRSDNPWKPEWLVHQNGYPYRSWCQHAFLLCLGCPEAARWALETVCRIVANFGADYLMIDSNEWAVCDDPSHGHGPLNGEWAQIHGLYSVLEGIRERFPELMVMHSSGGSQRADFAIARYSNCVHPHDNCYPSSKQRRFQYGTGFMYPNSYQCQHLGEYHYRVNDEGFSVPVVAPEGTFCSAERFEWRVMNRLLGYFHVGIDLTLIPDYQRDILAKGVRWAKRLRPLTQAHRYVPIPPGPLVHPEHREPDGWEAYQYVANDGSESAVYFYRCETDQDCECVVLRGLDPTARYRIEFWTDRGQAERSGADLMEQGLRCELARRLSAEIAYLTRIGGPE